MLVLFLLIDIWRWPSFMPSLLFDLLYRWLFVFPPFCLYIPKLFRRKTIFTCIKHSNKNNTVILHIWKIDISYIYGSSELNLHAVSQEHLKYTSWLCFVHSCTYCKFNYFSLHLELTESIFLQLCTVWTFTVPRAEDTQTAFHNMSSRRCYCPFMFWLQDSVRIKGCSDFSLGVLRFNTMFGWLFWLYLWLNAFKLDKEKICFTN